MFALSKKFRLAVVLLCLVALFGCAPEGDSGLEGGVLFQDKPLAGAKVEVYLKADKDRSVQPFAVATTDDTGSFRLSLPQGDYFLIGKKRDTTDAGRTRMLMSEAPGNPHTVKDGVRVLAPFNLREMGRETLSVATPDTGLSGQVTFEGAAVSRAYVYIYAEGDGDLVGPSYGEAVQTDEEGRFTINLPEGRYALVARKRVDGGRSGTLSAGDLNAPYPHNPVEIKTGEILALGKFPLTRVDARVLAQRQAEGVFTQTETALHGAVADADGLPVAEVYVFAYLDSRMVGKPVHMSAPTGRDGLFKLFLSDGGTYYVGARSSFGGPLEPGEWIGTFEGLPDHSVHVAKGQTVDLGTITVREFW